MFCALLGQDQVRVYRTIGPLVSIHLQKIFYLLKKYIYLDQCLENLSLFTFE